MRGVLLAVALACALGVVALLRVDQVPQPAAWLRWQDSHAEPRALAAAEQARHRVLEAEARHEDLLMLCAALALGCTVAALVRVPAQRRPALALSVGGVALGLFCAGRTALAVPTWTAAGRLCYGDSGLPSVAGPLASVLAEWRQSIPEDHAVLLVGTQDHLVVTVAWVLWPRPLSLAVFAVPKHWSGTEREALLSGLTLPSYAAGLWVVDLSALNDRLPDALLQVLP